jgi:hypothetical protein
MIPKQNAQMTMRDQIASEMITVLLFPMASATAPKNGASTAEIAMLRETEKVKKEAP